MSLQVTLQQRISSAQVLLQRAEQLCQGVEGHQKLCGKLRAELRFLRRVESGELQVKESHLHSTNLTHLTAIVESAESLEGVVALLHVFTYQDAAGCRQTLVVDVVANGGHTWVKAVGRKAEALHNIWQGRGQYGDKSIIRQAEDFLQASRQQPVQYRHPHIVFAFYNGVSCPMADRLRDMGISVRGDIVAVNAVVMEEEGDNEEEEEEEEEEPAEDDKEQEEESELTRVDRGTVVASLAFPAQVQVEECQRINLDITTLITYVSSLSHGRCHFTFREPVLTEQAAQERRQQVLPQLDAFMQGKELFACRAAVHDFQVILDTLGGPGEKERAQQLLARLHVVDDQPSERTLHLTPSAKVTTKVKQMKDNVSHTSGLVKLSELKGPRLPVRSLPVPDSVMTQRGGGSCEEEQDQEVQEEAPAVRRRSRKAAEGGESKVRGRRQKDFDPAAVEEEEAEPQGNREKVDPAVWTQNQQKLLELALQQFPRGTAERWDRIAKVVPGKTKEECMIRYKMLAELVQKKKQAKS